MRLGRIGFDIVEGYLRDGILALEPRPELVEETERIAPADASALLDSARPPLVLDVRSPRGVGTEAHRGQRQHSAQPPSRPARRAASRPHDSRALCGRLPVGDRGEHPAAARVQEASSNWPAASPPGKRRSCRRWSPTVNSDEVNVDYRLTCFFHNSQARS